MTKATNIFKRLRIPGMVIAGALASCMMVPGLALADEATVDEPTNDESDKKATTQTTETKSTTPVEPEKPDTDGLSATEANEKIDAYNDEVDAYNEAAIQENLNRQEAHEKEVEEVKAHNEAEDEKVAENKAALEKQANTEKWIETFDSRGITEKKTDKGSEVPDTYDEDSTELKTIKVDKAAEQSGKTNKVINVHLYIDAEFGTLNWYGANVTDEKLGLDKQLLDHIVTAEWETTTVDRNDTVTLVGQAKSMGYNSAAFYRYMPGYTNGYWVGSQECYYLADEEEYLWEAGAGMKLTGTNCNILSVYVYQFLRRGPEPEHVDVYTPNYRENPQAPEMLPYLARMANVEIPEVEIADESTPLAKVEEMSVDDEEVLLAASQTAVEPTAETAVEDEATPLASSTVAEETDVEEEATPLVASPVEKAYADTAEAKGAAPEVVVAENETPKSAAVKTGEEFPIAPATGLMAGLLAAAAALLRRRKTANEL